MMIFIGLQRGTINGAAPYGLGLNETTLPDYLKRVHYKTHMVGKVMHNLFVVFENILDT